MTDADPEPSWVDSLKEIQAPLGLVALSLRGLGVPLDVIGRSLSIAPDAVSRLVQDALALCFDARVRPRDQDYPFDVDLIGKGKLKELVDGGDLPCSDYPFTFPWAPTTDIISLTEGEDAFLQGGVDKSRTHMRMQTEDGFFDWFDEVRKVFISRAPRRELFLLLPLPTDGDFKWSIFRPRRALAGQDDALRLIASLSVLGLGYRDLGHRTKFFTDLIRTSQQLFDHIGVGGAAKRDMPADELLAKQLKGLANDALLIRQDASSRNRYPSSEVFAMDFSSSWDGNPNRFGDWSIRDRAQDADEMADALLWLMVRSSGICLQLSLTPRLPAGETDGHDVQILAPKPWIEFLSQGHGAQRGDKTFEPYLAVKDSKSTLYYIDEPFRYKQLRQLLKQQKN